jgi:hypothetical protein
MTWLPGTSGPDRDRFAKDGAVIDLVTVPLILQH